MKLDLSKSKAYAGAIGAGGGYLATEGVSDNIVVILVWLMSFAGNPPVEVAQAITFLIKVGVTMAIGYFITFYAPPNQVNPDGRVEAYVAELEKKQDEPASSN